MKQKQQESISKISAIFKIIKQSWIFTVMISFGVGLAIVGLLQPPPPQPAINIVEAQLPVVQPRKTAAYTVDILSEKFQKAGFDLSQLNADIHPVPRLWADSVPVDMGKIKHVQERKDLFMTMMLPIVLMVNERISRDRLRLLAIEKKLQAKEKVARADLNWLDNLVKSYRLKERDFAELKRRVDVVPVSLAVAQAAVESGWGTSRFAKKGNALFGQWTYGDDKGIVPDGRDEGKTHKIKAFDTPLDSVIAYIHNLNTNRAYKELRAVRAQKRRAGHVATGLDLTVGLERYSEKGMEYVYLLQDIIRHNKMERFDEAILGFTRITSNTNAASAS